MFKWGLGFGLERIGLAVLRWPRMATLLVLLSLIGSALSLPNLGFDGNIVNVVDRQSRAFKDFAYQTRQFYEYSSDVSVIIQSDRLITAEGLEALRNLHLDLTLEDNVKTVFSLFSLGDISQGAEEFSELLPEEFTSDAQAQKSIGDLLSDEPSASAIISAKEQTAVLLVRLQGDEKVSQAQLSKRLGELRATITALSPEDFNIRFSGMPQIRASIVDAIISDQTTLTLVGIIFGSLVSYAIFRTVLAAVICTIPAGIAVVWVLAVFATTGTSLNFFTTVLPSLTLIIAFADSIVLYFRWQTFVAAGGDGLDTLKKAVKTIGPASALTSITTALAFYSFSYASAETMKDLAYFGVIAVSLAFFSVIITLPLACYWSLKRKTKAKTAQPPVFHDLGRRIGRLTTAAPLSVLAISLVLLASFIFAHLQLRPSYAISDYLPLNSEIRATEAYVDKIFGGTSQYYVIVPVTKGGAFEDTDNRKRIADVDARISPLFDKGQTLSLARIWQRVDEDNIESVADAIREAPEAARGRVISKDGQAMLLSARTSSGANTLLAEKQVTEIRGALDDLAFAPDITITGLTVLLAKEFPILIDQLRTGLLVSIGLAVFVVGIATRSAAMAVATLIPNLLPILFTETIMWLMGANLDVSNVIALTIAFGISIDNAVHVINSYRAQCEPGVTNRDALSRAVGEISPALLASTVIICVSTIITQFSSMPSIAELGQLLIATLIVALISNLAVLPSCMLLSLRLFSRFETKTTQKSPAE